MTTSTDPVGRGELDGSRGSPLGRAMSLESIPQSSTPSGGGEGQNLVKAKLVNVGKPQKRGSKGD
jgi:hypothetical protein